MKFVNVFEKFDFLGEALNYVIKNSNSLYSPYHNLNHNVTVTVFSYILGKAEKLSESEIKELLITSIFHDFNHSAGKKKDKENIKEAKKGIRDFVKKNNVKINLEKVFKILEASEYPYVIKDKDLTLQQKIIRDADLLQLMEYNRLQFNIIGMAKEANVDIKKWLDIQTSFVENCKFNTKTAKKMKKIFWSDMVHELNYLKKVIK